MSVQGDYVLRVRLSGYSNPHNTCLQCSLCCDTYLSLCDLFSKACDNEFFYCLMPLGNTPLTNTIVDTLAVRNIATRADQLGCLQPPVSLRSDENTDGATINFLADTVLGLPNPLEFEVTADRWQGILLYVDVIDRDSGNADELVDVFLVPLPPPDIMAGANTTTPQQYSGRFGIATIELSFELECLPGYFGEECLNSTVICDPSPCDNGGVCSPDATNGFTCTCVGDFTGRSCDMTIDDCLNVNCNNGTCVDGVGTFTCECEAGYTGQFCEQLVMTAIPSPSPNSILNSTLNSTPSLTTSSSPSSNVGVVMGVVGGVVFALLITFITIVVLFLVVKHRGAARPRPHEDNSGLGTIAAAAASEGPLQLYEEMILSEHNVAYGIKTTGDEMVIATENNIVHGNRGKLLGPSALD